MNNLQAAIQHKDNAPHQFQNSISILRGTAISTLTSDCEHDNDIADDVRTRLLDVILRQIGTDGSHSDAVNHLEGAVVNHVEDAVDSLLLVVDDNMFYRSMRYEYYQLARKCKFYRYDIVTSQEFSSIKVFTLLSAGNSNMNNI